jgi:hypothetical protein
MISVNRSLWEDVVDTPAIERCSLPEEEDIQQHQTQKDLGSKETDEP